MLLNGALLACYLSLSRSRSWWPSEPGVSTHSKMTLHDDTPSWQENTKMSCLVFSFGQALSLTSSVWGSHVRCCLARFLEKYHVPSRTFFSDTSVLVCFTSHFPSLYPWALHALQFCQLYTYWDSGTCGCDACMHPSNHGSESQLLCQFYKVYSNPENSLYINWAVPGLSNKTYSCCCLCSSICVLFSGLEDISIS